VPLEHVGRLDHVVVDAHENHVVHLHGASSPCVRCSCVWYSTVRCSIVRCSTVRCWTKTNTGEGGGRAPRPFGHPTGPPWSNLDALEDAGGHLADIVVLGPPVSRSFAIPRGNPVEPIESVASTLKLHLRITPNRAESEAERWTSD
jgi:hypothetical protein